MVCHLEEQPEGTYSDRGAQRLSIGLIWMQQSLAVGKQWEMKLASQSESKWNAKRMMHFVNTAHLKRRPLKDF